MGLPGIWMAGRWIMGTITPDVWLARVHAALAGVAVCHSRLLAQSPVTHTCGTRPKPPPSFAAKNPPSLLATTTESPSAAAKR